MTGSGVYRRGSAQSGSVILETLIAILIFSLALLGLIGAQGTMIGESIEAKHRADAAYLANQIIGQMWVDRGNLAAYAHQPGGNACNPNGTASTNSNFTTWAAEVASVLPGAAAGKQQIVVTPDASATTYTVTVTLCWQRPQESSPHNFVSMAQINNP